MSGLQVMTPLCSRHNIFINTFDRCATRISYILRQNISNKLLNQAIYMYYK